ncbi:hypothetical protein BGM26_00105 [Bacillus sp. FJAT-29790]|nr:hypothetical protein [Bacillus sp. FJAT-29790]MBU8877387.1 hypothetical protein [Bacillus sp. FJAT-29790]
MEKQKKQHRKAAIERREEMQSNNEIANRGNGQPLPQPKDYEEIEY